MTIGHHVADRLHVTASAREVIRTARGCLLPRYQRGREHREARHQLYRQALEAHEANRKLYVSVMGGRI